LYPPALASKTATGLDPRRTPRRLLIKRPLSGK
jgi:hypothetical protein